MIRKLLTFAMLLGMAVPVSGCVYWGPHGHGDAHGHYHHGFWG